MLKKLLKYDLKSILKYWWIAALSSFVLSFAGGWCITILNSEKVLPSAINVLAVLALILVALSFAAFSILSIIFIFMRFYKNFFTDEGYLTFTLPVKRTQLLNAKLLSSGLTLIATGAVCIINILTMLCIGFADYIFDPSIWKDVVQTIKIVTDELGIYLYVYLFELVLLLLLCMVFSILFLFCCITFASIITKRAKVLASVGIYYVANGIFSFVIQIFYLFGIASLSNWLTGLPQGTEQPVAAFILLGVLFFIAMFCTLLYSLQYWMIDRKLNLS